MGCGDSKKAPTPTSTDTDDSEFPTCDPCVNQDLIAKGWCGQCNVYLCSKCIKSHAANHKIARGKSLPATRPRPESLRNNVSVKQVIPDSTLEDDELNDRADIPPQEKTIRGCVCIDGFIVTILYQSLRLYEANNFTCIQQVDLPAFSPNTICAHGYNMVVSFDRPSQMDESVNETPRKSKKETKFKDILSFILSPKGSSKAKVTKGGGFQTEGECFTVAMCPLFDKSPLIATGMTVEYHPIRDDLEFQVQILDTKGNVKQVLAINPRGEPCFEGRFFLSTTQNFDEIVISDMKERKVRGISIKTGKTIYEFGSGHPQGLTTDNEDNIYIFNDGALYWIPPLRNKIFYMHQQPGKRNKKSQQSKMSVSVSFDIESRILYVTNKEKTTIEAFRITK